jgi:PAS domain S-box-containing protein
MEANTSARSSLQAECDGLRERLAEAEDILAAIRSGDVDALVVESPSGPRLFTMPGVDAETNRLRGEILSQISDAVIVSDGEQRIAYLNAAAEKLYGVAASEALGRPISKLYSIRWGRPEEQVAEESDLRENGEWRGEKEHLTQNGHALRVETRVTMMREIPGMPRGRLAVIRDVTERNQHEDKVRVSEIRYRRLFEAAHDGVLLLDPATGKIIEANPFMSRMLNYPHSYLIGKELFEIGLLKDAGASREMVRKLKIANEVRYENLPLEGRDGQHQEVEVVANLYDENGRPVIQCNIRDITERKRAEEHVKLLMAEVNHRARNLLAVVQVMAQQTARFGDPTTFAVRLFDRIAGLAAGQDLLVKTEWQGIEMSDLIESQIAHFRELIGTRVLLEGPSLRLAAASAQGIGMAVHELATNAVKYGALSMQGGKVCIRWQLSSDDDPIFSMFWLEQGGPKVQTPTRKGFGQVVIGRMAEAAVNGSAETDFRVDGLYWSLKAPAADVVAPFPVRSQ